MKNLYVNKKEHVVSLKEGYLQYCVGRLIDGSIQHEIFNLQKCTFTKKPFTDEQNSKLISLEKYLV